MKNKQVKQMMCDIDGGAWFYIKYRNKRLCEMEITHNSNYCIGLWYWSHGFNGVISIKANK